MTDSQADVVIGIVLLTLFITSWGLLIWYSMSLNRSYAKLLKELRELLNV